MKRVQKSPFPSKSVMADEILGVWSVGDCALELSEARFCERRFIGAVWSRNGSEKRETDVAFSFAELDALIARLREPQAAPAAPTRLDERD